MVNPTTNYKSQGWINLSDSSNSGSVQGKHSGQMSNLRHFENVTLNCHFKIVHLNLKWGSNTSTKSNQTLQTIFCSLKKFRSSIVPNKEQSSPGSSWIKIGDRPGQLDLWTDLMNPCPAFSCRVTVSGVATGSRECTSSGRRVKAQVTAELQCLTASPLNPV